MNTDASSTLHTYADWIRSTDDHADYHLALLERVDQALAADAGGSASGALLDKLERWRYQHLQEHADSLSARNESFLDALDLLTNRLALRPDRSPRCTQRALGECSRDDDSIREAREVLDGSYPLDRLASRAAALTDAHFSGPVAGPPGATPAVRRRMLLYAPLYVSSHCVNFCTYCGFRYPLDIDRRHLSIDEAVGQVRVLRRRGFGHVLVVGGDYPQLTTTGYYCGILQALVAEGAVPGIEIAPQGTEAYAQLLRAGACGVTLYQETYDPRLYAAYHVRGPKANYHWRLESLDRAAEAGLPRLGLGVLLGLGEAHSEVLAMIRHGAYLAERFPDRTLAFSLPRIHDAPEGFRVAHPASDEQLVRLYCALRIAFPRAELVLSTRERPALRNRLAEICITQMSAGSSTAPGGYESSMAAGEQFPIADHRSVEEVAEWLEQSGFRVARSIEAAGAI